MRRSWLVGTAFVLTLVAGLETRTFVVPPSDRPATTDGIIVLGPGYIPTQMRSAMAVRALRPGTPVLLSSPAYYCPHDLPSGVSCFDPVPFTTQGEAEFAARYAQAHGWRDMTVIAPPAQLSRARIRFERCWSGQLRMVASQLSIASRLRRLPYETAAMGKALLVQRRC